MTKEKFVRKNVHASRLEEIAGNCNSPKASTTSAVCMVSETLEKMFKTHKTHEELSEAFNLYDYSKMSQEELRELALNHENLYVQCFAISRLTDQETLEWIALNSECHIFREMAIRLITNTKILKHIFIHDNVWSVQYEALERLSKLNCLSEIIPCSFDDCE